MNASDRVTIREERTERSHTSDSLPLIGLRVLDLSRVLAGPLCTMILGDLGASVIKVDGPGPGDETRGWGPPFDPQGRSAYYLSVNRNKLGISLDLDNPTDLALVRDLIGEADVVVDNFRAGVLERRGIDPSLVLEARSDLIWCTITGFGQSTNRPGYDFVVQAEAGWMAITGTPDGDPMKVGVALADVIAGKDAAIMILAARAAAMSRRSPRTAASRRLTVSLAASARGALVNVAQNALVSRAEATRWGNAHPNLVPYELFHASDRAIVIAVGSDVQWAKCARALGLSDLAADPELATNAGRLAARRTIVTAFAARLATRTAADWQQRLDAVGVPNGVVRSVLEVIRDVDASAVSGMPSSVGGSVRLDPPALDEHGALIRVVGWGAFSQTGRS
ncbi:MAG TPA: CoA transferase [Gemmatimonadaceae bacterium]|nr:CoA transferase [Gemmatimonadaceae bacterium]